MCVCLYMCVRLSCEAYIILAISFASYYVATQFASIQFGCMCAIFLHKKYVCCFMLKLVLCRGHLRRRSIRLFCNSWKKKTINHFQQQWIWMEKKPTHFCFCYVRLWMELSVLLSWATLNETLWWIESNWEAHDGMVYKICVNDHGLSCNIQNKTEKNCYSLPLVPAINVLNWRYETHARTFDLPHYVWCTNMYVNDTNEK